MEAMLQQKAAKPLKKEVHRYALKATTLFSDFSNDMLDEVLDHTILKECKKSQLLCLTGDKADYFYVIIHGLVKLFRETRDGHEAITAVLTSHDVFGRNTVIKDATLPYSAQAVTDTTLLMISADFMQYMTEHSHEYDHFLSKFLQGGLDEAGQLGLEIEHLALMTSTERVGCYLLKLCGNQREGSISFDLPYEKSLVAGRLGMKPETFSRSLNQLSEIGVEVKNATVTIHNIAQLQARICGHCSALHEECNNSEED